jgi:hypothetical protein
VVFRPARRIQVSGLRHPLRVPGLQHTFDYGETSRLRNAFRRTDPS